MKNRIASILLALCMVISISVFPAHATDYSYTYYSQNGWTNNNGKKLTGMCYLTSLAMIISDLGKKVTPVDVYYANGGVINCNFDTISNYYGLSYSKEAVNTYSNEAAKRQKIADVLASGKYPAGILVIGRTNGTNHMVVARRVVNGTIYCDDPVNGKNIPISNTWRVSENIISYWMFTPTSKWNSSGTSNSSTTPTVTNTPAVATTESGKWYVEIPANYKLLLYSNTTSASSTYISARSAPYWLVCSEKATLSNGAIQYYAAVSDKGTEKHYWFIYTNDMNIEDPNEASNQSVPTDFSLTFNQASYSLGDQVVITPSATNATHYNISVWKGAFKTGERLYWEENVTGNISFPIYYTGTYTIRADAVNSAGYISTEKAFTVAEAEVPAATPSNGGYWGPWSEWSTNYVEESSTRHVESQQVKVSDEHTEYRYGRYIDSTGAYVGWCAKYMTSRYSPNASIQYSDWSTIRYADNGTKWTCGYCGGDHTHALYTSSDGRAFWARHVLPEGNFYWEESRVVDAQSETQYRYQDWIPG